MPVPKDTASSILDLIRGSKIDHIPTNVTPFAATTQSAIAGTTPVAIKAAVTGKRHWITGCSVTNHTASEDSVVVLQDDTGTPIVAAVVQAKSLVTYNMSFDIPLEIAAGKAINGRAMAATGDSFCTVFGFVEN